MRRWRRLLELNAAQRRTLFLALAVLPVAGLGLRWLGLRRVQALLGATASGAANRAGHAEETAWLLSVAARHGPYRASCLPTALTLKWLLRRQGIDADLRLGVRKVAGCLEAHAWLEREGRPLPDTGETGEPFAAFEKAIAPAPGASR
jgi:hypothetical protein